MTTPASPPKSQSRVLPQGGAFGGASSKGVPPLSLQTVDRPNPNAKFSKSKPSVSNISTVFNTSGPVPSPRFGKKVDPSAGMSRSSEVTPRSTLKISRFDEQQAAAAKYKEDHRRPLRRMIDTKAPNTARTLSPSAHSEPTPAAQESTTTEPASPSSKRASFTTTNGLEYSGGRKPAPQKHETSMHAPLPPQKDFGSMERFKASDRTSPRRDNVLRPETLPSHVPPPKAQRFQSSPTSRHNSLVGVFGPDPSAVAPPAYRPRAPFHTD